MDEISLHVLDIVQNSISANATLIIVNIIEDTKEDKIEIEIIDNGKGMSEEELKLIENPFYTTKNYKKVGLGIPLLKQIALSSDGDFKIESKKGEFTKVYIKFKKSHPDTPPIGNLKDTILTLILTSENFDIKFHYKKENKILEIDSREIKKFLGDIPINHPEVIKFIRNYLNDNFKNLEVQSET
ncbi:MAG: sensor histidine kinase [Caldisericia bacterium]|nr:sensor histidine kinase [Caldisericia bacterium]